jgi:hypothetical protein
MMRMGIGAAGLAVFWSIVACANPAGVADNREIRLQVDPPDDVVLPAWKEWRPLSLLLEVKNAGATPVRLPPLSHTMLELRTQSGEAVPLHFRLVPGADTIKQERFDTLPLKVAPGQTEGMVLKGRVSKEGRIEFFPWILEKPVPAGAYELRVAYAPPAQEETIPLKIPLWTGRLLSNWIGITFGSARSARPPQPLSLSLEVKPRVWPLPASGTPVPAGFGIEIAIRNGADRAIRVDLARLEFRLRDLSWADAAKYATMGGLPFRVRNAAPDARTPGQLPALQPGATLRLQLDGRLTKEKGLELACGEPGRQTMSTEWWTGGALSPESLVQSSPVIPRKRPMEIWFEYECGDRIREVNAAHTLMDDLWLGAAVASQAARVTVEETKEGAEPSGASAGSAPHGARTYVCDLPGDARYGIGVCLTATGGLGEVGVLEWQGAGKAKWVPQTVTATADGAVTIVWDQRTADGAIGLTATKLRITLHSALAQVVVRVLDGDSAASLVATPRNDLTVDGDAPRARPASK